MRILIADDEAIIRLGMTQMLEEMGHTVVGAAPDGSTAVEMARTLQPELVILDIKMPGMNGLDAAEAIARERPTPILILTAYGDRELVERAASQAVYGYLIKPVQPADLEPALQVAATRFEQWKDLQKEASSLKGALEAREVIERAKRLLIDRDHLSEGDAFRFIQATARRQRRPMRDVAQEILGERN